MKYNFDETKNRIGTNSLKWDFATERGMPDDLLPLWVADMDFSSPPEVLEDVKEVASRGIFGYTEAGPDYYEALTSWFSTRYAFKFSSHEVVMTPGVVFALAMCVKAFTARGDAVLVQRPVYYPFFDIVLSNERRLVSSALRYENGVYTIDYDDFEQRIVGEKVKLFIMSNPHNPVGRVWSNDELLRVHEICRKHGVIVVSDEIHCDFVFAPHSHTCYGLIDENAIIATAPSKTFNLAGFQVSNIVVKNDDMRKKLRAEMDKSGYDQLNIMGIVACQSAYSKGGSWLEALKEYIANNIAFTRKFLGEHLPNVRLVPTQGTYLLWLDFLAYNMSHDELDRKIIDDAKLWLDSGTMFGPEGTGFQRINAGCPRATLELALGRLASAFRE